MDDEGHGLCCPDCGPVAVAADRAEVHGNRREDLWVAVAPCPGCGQLLATGARGTVVALLAAGARRLELRSTAAPLVSHDDLLDLHEWLARDEPWPVEGALEEPPA